VIKAIVGYKLKEGADFGPILRKLWSQAAQSPGFIGAENLLSEADHNIVALVTTWETIENWHGWEKSRIRQDILREAAPLLEEDPRVTVYTVTPTVRWVG
jgi:heme-degrading monooxygenase HmoA